MAVQVNAKNLKQINLTFTIFSLFGYYDDHEKILGMRDREIYRNGYLGLKELDERGRLNIYEIAGVEHHAWRKNYSVVDDYILPFLD